MDKHGSDRRERTTGQQYASNDVETSFLRFRRSSLPKLDVLHQYLPLTEIDRWMVFPKCWPQVPLPNVSRRQFLETSYMVVTVMLAGIAVYISSLASRKVFLPYQPRRLSLIQLLLHLSSHFNFRSIAAEISQTNMTSHLWSLLGSFQHSTRRDRFGEGTFDPSIYDFSSPCGIARYQSTIQHLFMLLKHGHEMESCWVEKLAGLITSSRQHYLFASQAVPALRHGR